MGEEARRITTINAPPIKLARVVNKQEVALKITDNDRKLAGMYVEPCMTFKPEVVALAQETGLKPSSVKQYLYSMSPEQIKARPKLKPRAGSIFHDGEHYTINQFAKIVGTGKDRVRALIRHGLEPSEIIATHRIYSCSGDRVVGIKRKYVTNGGL